MRLVISFPSISAVTLTDENRVVFPSVSDSVILSKIISPVLAISLSSSALIDGKEITNLTNGDIKIKAIASDIEKDTNMVMIVAVYKENGVIDTVRMAEQKIIGDGELMLDLNVTDAEHQTLKVFIFDDFTNLHPIINVTNFL